MICPLYKAALIAGMNAWTDGQDGGGLSVGGVLTYLDTPATMRLISCDREDCAMRGICNGTQNELLRISVALENIAELLLRRGGTD